MQVRYVSLQIRSNHYFLENLSYCETPLNIGGLSVKFWDFSEILQLFLYWKFCGLCAWVVDRDSVLVHHGLGEGWPHGSLKMGMQATQVVRTSPRGFGKRKRVS
jgi:hypothetical protein